MRFPTLFVLLFALFVIATHGKGNDKGNSNDMGNSNGQQGSYLWSQLMASIGGPSPGKLPKCIDTCVGLSALSPDVCASQSDFVAGKGSCVCNKLSKLSDLVGL